MIKQNKSPAGDAVAPPQKKTEFSMRLRAFIDEQGMRPSDAARRISTATGEPYRRVLSHVSGERSPSIEGLTTRLTLYAQALGVEPNALIALVSGDAPIKAPAENVVRLHPDTPPAATILSKVPFPQAAMDGADLFLWRIPEGDYSMVGGSCNLTPGMYVICDRVAEIVAGNAILCRPRDFSSPIIRFYKASRPLKAGRGFDLTSPNPNVEMIHVAQARTCGVLGRVRYTINHL